MTATTIKADEPMKMTIQAEANGPLESRAAFTYLKK
jgi:hypothetical protein